MIRILLVEDNPGDARLVDEMLREPDPTRFTVTRVDRVGKAVRRLASERFDAILLDLDLPDARGLEALPPVVKAAPGVPIVVLSGAYNEASAVEAVQNGAQDYLIKGKSSGELVSRAILYAIQRKQSERYVTHLANHDGLTGLPNRRLFLDRLGQAVARTRRHRQRLAVLFVDLDHLKTINDTLGHAVGDLLLKCVGDRLKACMRESDTVARLAGDEFTLILPEVNRLQDVSGFAEKVLEAFRPPFLLGPNEVSASPSIGISLYPNDGEDAETLLRSADAAMYRAKRQGGGTYQFFFPAMNLKASQRLAMARGLKDALDRDEFVLHYQPEVDLATGRVVGVEALVRWRQADLGLVAPGQFLRVAEETGLIVPLGDWVLNRACTQARTWQDEGLPRLRVGVNLSGQQFNQPGLQNKVTQALNGSGLRADCLELELTEGGIMRDETSAVATLKRLDAMGIRLAIDDFGTGYSSLSQLHRFPFDTLKIDQSFIQDIRTHQDDGALVRAIIAMAHGFSLNVLGEGVETAGQVEFLRRHGCDQTQGFYFSHPLPADSVTDLLRMERTLGQV
jgi:diguanylate cyclase (GGDEF)-like protein